MTLRSGEELSWGLTNLPILIAALVLMCLLEKYKEAKGKTRAWQAVYLGFAFAALNGFLFHSFEIPRRTVVILWVIQYVFFYAAGFLFHLRVMSLLTNGRYPGEKLKKILSVLVILFAVITIILNLTLPAYEDALILFIVFAVIMLLPMLYLTFFGKVKIRPLKCMCLVLALSLASQALSTFFGPLVAVGHVFDVLALVFGYFTARIDILEK